VRILNGHSMNRKPFFDPKKGVPYQRLSPPNPGIGREDTMHTGSMWPPDWVSGLSILHQITAVQTSGMRVQA